MQLAGEEFAVSIPVEFRPVNQIVQIYAHDVRGKYPSGGCDGRFLAARSTPDPIAGEQSCCQPPVTSGLRCLGHNGDKNAWKSTDRGYNLVNADLISPPLAYALQLTSCADGCTMTDAITPSKSDMQNRVLQVASSFTSRPLAKTLQPYLVGAGVADAVEFIEYGQVAEYMLGPTSGAERILGTVVLVRVEDSLRNELKNGATSADIGAKARQQLAVQVDEFVKQVTTLAKRRKPIWLLACPSNGWVAESCNLGPLCRTYTNLLLARVRGTPNVTVFDWPGSLADSDINDRNTDRLGQIPFTPVAFEHLGQILGPEIEAGLATKAVSASPTSSNGKADLAKFLAGLELRVRLAAPESGDRAHVDRILRTAAAFSLTGEKRDLSDAEVDLILQSGGCLLVTVGDRLSTYGPSGVVSFRTDPDLLVVEELALSCPVLGKQVEYAVILGLAQIAASRGCSKLVFEYKASGRNQIMLKFLESIADPARDMRFALQATEADERIRKTAVAPGTWTLEFGS